MPELSQEFLTRMAAGEANAKVHVAVGSDGGFAHDITRAKPVGCLPSPDDGDVANAHRQAGTRRMVRVRP